MQGLLDDAKDALRLAWWGARLREPSSMTALAVVILGGQTWAQSLNIQLFDYAPLTCGIAFVFAHKSVP